MPKLGLVKSLSYPVLRHAFYFAFTYIPYAPIRKLNHPEHLSAPIVWAPTHSNFLCDVSYLGFEGLDPPKFVAKHTLFRFPIETFMHFGGGVPVVRAEDVNKAGGDRRQNRRTFEKVIEALGKGWSVCIFPEGMSVVAPGLLLPIKLGVAKLSLAAEDSFDFSLGLHIVPLAFEYGHRKRIGSGLIARYGTPIRVSEYREIFERDSNEAVRLIMSRITCDFIENFPHFASWEDFRCGEELWLAGLCETKCDAARLLRGLTGEKRQEFFRAFTKFRDELTARKIRPAHWGALKQWRAMGFRRRFVLGLFAILGILPALWYLANGLVADAVTCLLAWSISSDETEFMTVRMMGSLVVCGIVFPLQWVFLDRMGFHLPLSLYIVINIADWYFVKHWWRCCELLYGRWRASWRQSPVLHELAAALSEARGK